MTTQYRRNSTSATAPYTIPLKHQHQHNHGSPSTASTSVPSKGQHSAGPISTSGPSLSREFVVRRISEGETGRLKEELKCEACGKGYKHISSLAKHLWEHTPEWNVTKKLLISKHQQVQLLEAASILVGMNETSPRAHDSAVVDDDLKSPSPQPYSFPRKQDRSHSISQYPPSTMGHARSDSLPGGYLDTPNGAVHIKNRSNSIAVEEDELKSPPASYVSNSIWPSRTNNSYHDSSEHHSPEPDSFEEESVIGKLE